MVIRGRSALGGGSISHVERIDTNVGPFVLKWISNPPAGLFDAEAAGLDALRAARSGFVIPRVVTTSRAASEPADAEPQPAPAFLVIEFLSTGTKPDDAHEQVGHALAALHRTSHEQFGFHRDTFCGTTRQPNRWTTTWVEFYATSRLGCQIRLAAAAGLIDAGAQRALTRLTDRLDTLLIDPIEGAALIHGDLWPGNLHMTADGTPALLDPAVSFSHREAELGMMTLFGGFPARVLEAYGDAWPLETGWQERRPLYELYHLLNHLNLFGGAYHAEIMTIVRRFS